MNSHYNIADLVPHSGAMSLLDKVVEKTDDSIRMITKVRNDGLFDENNKIPAWLGIEYMAQTVAAFSGYYDAQKGMPAKVGVLLGTRKFTTSNEYFICGDQITVTATELLRQENGIAAFDCTIQGQGIEQQALLTVFQPSNLDEYLLASTAKEMK